VATYSYSPVAIEALARVLTGEVKPSGKLPVDIPVAGAPDTVLYPFGFGLTY
jgi:beta-N-acetylhexosaminidase